jgi:RES domain-containing protein
MSPARKVRDNTLIDALEASASEKFDSVVWRVVRADRDPLRGSAAGGRWDDGTFEVLYTSLERDGALSEMYFHLARGQPIIPSKMAFSLYKIRVKLGRALRLADLQTLARLGVEIKNYGLMEHSKRVQEYPRTQEIGEAAHFLEFDGLIVPSARMQCANVILFTDRIPPESLEIVETVGPIDWTKWKPKPP